MNTASPGRSRAVSVEISPRMLAFLILFLRVGLGITLFNAGLFRIQIQMQMMNSGQPNFLAMTYSPMTGVVPGTELLYQFIPYLECGVGLALIMGFMTTYAAIAAGALLLVAPFSHTLSLLGGSITQNRWGNGMMGGGFPWSFSGEEVSKWLLVALVVWLSPHAINRFSFDAMMFTRRQRRLEGVRTSVPTTEQAPSWVGRAGTTDSDAPK